MTRKICNNRRRPKPQIPGSITPRVFNDKTPKIDDTNILKSIDNFKKLTLDFENISNEMNEDIDNIIEDDMIETQRIESKKKVQDLNDRLHTLRMREEMRTLETLKKEKSEEEIVIVTQIDQPLEEPIIKPKRKYTRKVQTVQPAVVVRKELTPNQIRIREREEKRKLSKK